MKEQRKHPRHKSLLQGRVAFNDGRSSIDCLIRDMSESGARLRFSGTVALPDIAELQIPSKHESHPINVIWGTGDEYGVVFVDGVATDTAATGAESAAPHDVESRLHKLESEVMSLRRIIAELRAERSERQVL